MLKIRLQRVGRKHDASFRVVSTDARHAAQSGKFLEILGNYNPRRKTAPQLKTERIRQLLKQGAQTSGTVHNLLVDAEIISGPKRNVSPSVTPRQKAAKPQETAQETARTPAQSESEREASAPQDTGENIPQKPAEAQRESAEEKQPLTESPTHERAEELQNNRA